MPLVVELISSLADAWVWKCRYQHFVKKFVVDKYQNKVDDIISLGNFWQLCQSVQIAILSLTGVSIDQAGYIINEF
jgi:hypothetical protein